VLPALRVDLACLREALHLQEAPGVWGLVFRIWCLGFGVWCLGFGVWVEEAERARV